MIYLFLAVLICTAYVNAKFCHALYKYPVTVGTVLGFLFGAVCYTVHPLLGCIVLSSQACSLLIKPDQLR